MTKVLTKIVFKINNIIYHAYAFFCLKIFPKNNLNKKIKYFIKEPFSKKNFFLKISVSGESKLPIIDTHFLRVKGLYEWHSAKFLSEHIKQNYNILEIGAAEGYFTIIMAKLVGSKGKIISFEPNSLAFSQLKENLKINNIKNVKIINKAFANNSRQILFSSNNKKLKFLKSTFLLKNINYTFDLVFIDVDAVNYKSLPVSQELEIVKYLLNNNVKIKCFYIERSINIHSWEKVMQQIIAKYPLSETVIGKKHHVLKNLKFC